MPRAARRRLPSPPGRGDTSCTNRAGPSGSSARRRRDRRRSAPCAAWRCHPRRTEEGWDRRPAPSAAALPAEALAGGRCVAPAPGAARRAVPTPAEQKRNGIGAQPRLRRHYQPKLLREAAALLRLRERRAVLLGNEGRDVGRELVARVLVAVVVPAKDGREPAGPQHLGDKHRLAVADRGRPPGCGRRFALALLDRLVEWVDAGVVPRLVAIDERAGAPGLIADV